MRESDPLLERLADANPVPEGSASPGARSSAPEDLLARLLMDGSTPSVAPDPRRRPTRRAAAAGVLLASLIGGVLILRGGGNAPASAAELMLRTAALAAGRDTPTPGGPYLYSKSEADVLITSGENTRGWSVTLPVTEETWIASDGSGRSRSSTGPPRYFGLRDQERWEAAGSPEFASGFSDEQFPAGILLYEDLRLLPTRVSALEGVLRDSVSSQHLPSDVAVFGRVGELLARGDASPGLRAALYRVVAQLPGVELIGDTTDPSGRPGIAVAMTYDESGAAVQVVMIFDADTSALLAQESVLLERASWVDASPGTRLSFVTYLEAGWTESVLAPPSSSAGRR